MCIRDRRSSSTRSASDWGPPNSQTPIACRVCGEHALPGGRHALCCAPAVHMKATMLSATPSWPSP
eukprot:7893590-Prorocentrum_lima.AAC.1